MKKLIIAVLMALPMAAMAQSTLTPQEQLEQAQRQLEQAQAALEQAKANAAKAQEAKQKAEAEAKAKAEAAAKQKAEQEAKAKAEAEAKAAAIQKQIEEAKAEAARLNAEAARLEAEAQKAAETAAPVSTPVAETPASKPLSTSPSQQWTAPQNTPVLPQPAAKTEKTEEVNHYTAEGAVPLVDGQVEWSMEISAPGLSADQIYSKLLIAQTQLTQGEGQLEGSKVALVNEADHSIVTTVREWMTFTSSFLSLDRTEFYYVLETQCRDGGATVKMNRIKYVYTTQTSVDRYTAENWITDKVAVNKKHTKLYRGTGKFRRGTIDRKDAVFKYLNDAIKLL